jgi:hypothetical protein
MARLYRPVDWGDDDSEKGEENIDEQIVTALGSGPQTASGPAEVVGATNPHAVRTALSQLSKVGRVTTVGASRQGEPVGDPATSAGRDSI